MLTELKKQMMANPESLVRLLEMNEFAHITHHSTEIRFARDEDGGKNIRIRLAENPNISVTDFVKNIHTDIIAYIMAERNKTFAEVMNDVKCVLGIESSIHHWYSVKTEPFGGLYSKLKKKKLQQAMIYDESILDAYCHLPNKRFLDDHISLRTQRCFGIGYDTESNRITIPVRNEVGELIGVKGRRNDDSDEYGPKYLYLIPAQSSLTLYGYSSNYEYLYNDLVILTESEKSVMQAYSYHYRNVVALSGDSISDKQVKLIYQLSPIKIVVALDADLEDKYTNKIVNALTSYYSMSSAEIWRWDSKNTPNIENKSSLTDAGKEKFLDILENNLIRLV